MHLENGNLNTTVGCGDLENSDDCFSHYHALQRDV